MTYPFAHIHPLSLSLSLSLSLILSLSYTHMPRLNESELRPVSLPCYIAEMSELSSKASFKQRKRERERELSHLRT